MCSHSLLSTSICKAIAFLLFICTVFSIGNTQAVTIDFDDLNPADFYGEEGEFNTPLTNQYESLGIIFEGGSYVGGIPGQFSNIISGPGFSFYFTDELPTYVSMYVGSADQLKVGVSIYGVNGHIETKLTEGGVRGMEWEQSTPYRDNQFVSFFAAEGISYVGVGSQATAYMDNLSFEVIVPEPNAFILLWLGLLMIYLHRKRLQ
ncbi:MAG TPA: hypothetical protein VLC79_18270 [Cellvibrio sp.]|nr:hypothetical protein [Cellvibrio sp.]